MVLFQVPCEVSMHVVSRLTVPSDPPTAEAVASTAFLSAFLLVLSEIGET